jgi:hypothetical protein
MRTLRNWTVLALFIAGCALVGCEDEKKPEAPKKVNEFSTGRFALQKMLGSAHLWSPDAQPIQLQSTPTSESDGHDGKSANWRATFGSRARSKSEPFTWTGLASVSHKVDHGVEDTYNPNNRSTQTWDLNFLKADTDQAIEVAQKHGGKELLEKEPKLPVTYLLAWNPQSNQLVWHVIYGESPARLTVLVDASSGAYLRKE